MENFSSYFLAIILLLILISGVKSRVEIFDEFVKGAHEAIRVLVKIFPTILGLFVGVGLLKACGILEMISLLVAPVAQIFGIPKEIVPLAILRPFSGSASLAVAANIFADYGPDSKPGVIASVLMGTTETVLYVVAVYFGAVGVKKIRYVLYCALFAEFVGIILSSQIVTFLYTLN